MSECTLVFRIQRYDIHVNLYISLLIISPLSKSTSLANKTLKVAKHFRIRPISRSAKFTFSASSLVKQCSSQVPLVGTIIFTSIGSVGAHDVPFH